MVEVRLRQVVPSLPVRHRSQLCLTAGVGYLPLNCTIRSVPVDPSLWDAVSSSMAVISAHEIAQAVLNPVNLVKGRKLIMWEAIMPAVRAGGMDHCPR